MRRSVLIGAVMLGCLGPTTARADAVPPPPVGCPAGSEGDSCHGGEYCAPSRCTDPSSCPDGYGCESLPLCIGQVDCAGGWILDSGPSYTDTVEGSCADGATCAAGSCESVRVCVPPAGAAGGSAAGAPGSTIIEQGCTCRTTGGRVGSGAALVALFGVPGLLVARRPSRRRRRAP